MADPNYQITAAFLRAAVEEFSKNPKKIYGSESEFNGAMYSSRNSSFRKWSRVKRCSFDECEASSIVNSHAIPGGMMRDSVTLNNHVMTPDNNGSGKLTVRLLGVNEASVFPGYCKHHEDFFKDFESKKSIDNDQERFLQIYRSTDRELYRAKHWYEHIESELNIYTKKRNDFILRRTNELLFEKIGRRLKELPNVSLDGIQSAIKERLAELQELISTLENKLLPHAKSCAFSDGSNNDGVIYKKEVPFVIPVALSGYGDFRTPQKLIRVVIGVIPQKAKTNIFMLGAEQDRTVLDDYWNQRTENPSAIFGMISSWMTHGTDQWYFNPGHWNKISKEIQSKIIKGIGSIELNIAAPSENIFSCLEQSL